MQLLKGQDASHADMLRGKKKRKLNGTSEGDELQTRLISLCPDIAWRISHYNDGYQRPSLKVFHLIPCCYHTEKIVV
jgi:hypothetical protein